MQPKLQEQRGQRSKSCHATFTVFHHLHRVAQHATEKKMLSLNWQNNIRFDCPCTYGLVELKRRAKCTFPSNFVVCSWLYNPLFWLVSLSVSQSENQSVLAFWASFAAPPLMLELACVINGPAHPNAISVVVYPALFFIQGGCGEAKNCSYLLWSYFFSFLFLLAIVNRSMTLYLSYKRAWSFYNVTNALKSQEQYHHRVLIDLTVFTAIFVIIQLLFLFQKSLVFLECNKCFEKSGAISS